MKTLLSCILIVISTLVVQAQINFSASSLSPVMYGCGDWITIDSSTGEQALVLGGSTDFNAQVETSGEVKLYTQDAGGQWTLKHNFFIQSDEPHSAFFYQGNYVYIAFVTLFSGVKVFRALMDGNANFVQIYTNYDLAYVQSTITNIDINNDGFEDFLFSGLPYYGITPDVGYLQNNGDGTFSLASSPVNIPQANGGYYKSAYLDNSGLKHLVVVSNSLDAVFRNNGDGTFDQIYILQETPRDIHITTTDLNNDSLHDISIIAPDEANSSGTIVYKNLGNLDFQPYDSDYSGLPDIRHGEMEYADINNDGYPDAVAAGKLSNNTVLTKIYFGSDDFKFFGTEYTLSNQSGNPIILSNGTIAISDYNNDGKPDLLLTGREPSTFDTYSWLMTNTSTLSITHYNREGFTMYPNPAQDIVSFKGADTLKSIKVFNQLGQQVLSTRDTHSINIESLSVGVYHVVINTGSGTSQTKKLLIE